MLQEIWHTVQLIWNDPVWSKVISAVVLLIIPAIWAYCRGWFPSIRQWLGSEIIVQKLFLFLLFPIVPVFVASATWRASGAIQVEPRDKGIAFLTEEVAKRNKIISEWKEAYETNQKQSELLFGNSKTLGETCKEAT